MKVYIANLANSYEGDIAIIGTFSTLADAQEHALRSRYGSTRATVIEQELDVPYSCTSNVWVYDCNKWLYAEDGDIWEATNDEVENNILGDSFENVIKKYIIDTDFDIYRSPGELVKEMLKDFGYDWETEYSLYTKAFDAALDILEEMAAARESDI